MSSVVRSALGAALLLTSASAAMAQSYSTPVASNAPVASEPVQTQAPEAVVAAVEAPVVVQSSRPRYAGLWCDNTDQYGGHGPNTLWGRRTFWANQSDD